MKNLNWWYIPIIFILLTTPITFYGSIKQIEYIESLEEQLNIQKDICIKYEEAITDMMQGQWTPGMSLQKIFIKEWYGTPIWAFKAANRLPGSPDTDIKDILDGKIKGIDNDN